MNPKYMRLTFIVIFFMFCFCYEDTSLDSPEELEESSVNDDAQQSNFMRFSQSRDCGGAQPVQEADAPADEFQQMTIVVGIIQVLVVLFFFLWFLLCVRSIYPLGFLYRVINSISMVVNADLPAKHKHSLRNKTVPDKLFGGGPKKENVVLAQKETMDIECEYIEKCAYLEEQLNMCKKMMLDCADVVAFMINQCKCNIIADGSDENGYTALMLSAKYGLKEIASVLCSRSDTNLQTKDGVTALMEACSYNQLEVMQLLLASGCDINHTTNEQMNALMLATIKGNTDIVRYLLNHNASLHTSDHLGNTALMLAVEHGHLQIIQLLLEEGAAIFTQNSQGRTPLMIASKQNFVEAATILLMFSPEEQLQIQNHNGETALMLASKYGNVELVALFLQHGADGWKENFQGFTAKILANKFGQTTSEDMLTVWERKNPLKLDHKIDTLDFDMTIEQFLATTNLAHLTYLFVDSFVMETVGEFKTLNQKKRNIIQKQLSSSDLEVLDSSLATMGIFMKHFLPSKSDRQETPTPAQQKTNKINAGDAPA